MGVDRSRATIVRIAHVQYTTSARLLELGRKAGQRQRKPERSTLLPARLAPGPGRRAGSNCAEATAAATVSHVLVVVIHGCHKEVNFAVCKFSSSPPTSSSFSSSMASASRSRGVVCPLKPPRAARRLCSTGGRTPHELSNEGERPLGGRLEGMPGSRFGLFDGELGGRRLRALPTAKATSCLRADRQRL